MITKHGLQKRLAKSRIVVPPKEILLDPAFSAQNDFINDTSRSLVACCSRRAGKTNALAIRFFKTLAKYPKSQSLYVALTQDSAKEIMWPVLHEINDKFGIGCKLVESKMTMYHPNGARLRVIGADLSNFIKRLKGRKYPGVAIDEAQDFGYHLQSLVDDVLTPSTADYPDGWLALTGTPGPLPKGYFFDITESGRYGYSSHKWTLFDNPYMPNPRDFVDGLKKKREWTDDNPTLRREYLNQWVLDSNSLWIRYNEKLNHFTELPKNKWNYILGIDVGFNDADALAVLAWSEECSETYLVEETVTRKQGLTELVKQVQAADARYKFSKMVIDAGGLGKKLAEEMRRQHRIPVQDADKSRKQETVEFLNDNLRTGKFKAKSASQFAQDSHQVQIDWDKSSPDKIVVKKKPHSDIIDAVIYAFKESPAFSFEAPKIKPKQGTKEYYDQLQQELEERAEEHFKEIEKQERYRNSMGFSDN